MEKTKFEFILGQEADVIQAFAEGPMPEQFSEEQLIAQSIVAMGDLVHGVPHRTEEKTKFEELLICNVALLAEELLNAEESDLGEPDIDYEYLFIAKALIAMGED